MRFYEDAWFLRMIPKHLYKILANICSVKKSDEKCEVIEIVLKKSELCHFGKTMYYLII